MTAVRLEEPQITDFTDELGEAPSPAAVVVRDRRRADPERRAAADVADRRGRRRDALRHGALARADAGDAPRAVLVVPASVELDATGEAIRIARALARRERTILVDLTRGPAAVSGQLGLPRAPGFTDLAAGSAGFEDVLQAEDATSLQIIPAGNPHIRGDGEEEDAARIIAALSQVYDRLVLHADRETLRKLEPALDGRLQLVVAVIARGDTAKHEQTALGELTAFGCQVVPYEQSLGEERPRRLGFFGRAAAV